MKTAIIHAKNETEVNAIKRHIEDKLSNYDKVIPMVGRSIRRVPNGADIFVPSNEVSLTHAKANAGSLYTIFRQLPEYNGQRASEDPDYRAEYREQILAQEADEEKFLDALGDVTEYRFKPAESIDQLKALRELDKAELRVEFATNAKQKAEAQEQLIELLKAMI
jgi:hypothetical protein